MTPKTVEELENSQLSQNVNAAIMSIADFLVGLECWKMVWTFEVG